MVKSGINRVGSYRIRGGANGLAYIEVDTDEVETLVCLGDNEYKLNPKYENWDISYDKFIDYKYWKICSFETINSILPLSELVWQLRYTSRVSGEHSVEVDKELIRKVNRVKDTRKEYIMIASIRCGTEVEQYGLFDAYNRQFKRINPDSLFKCVQSGKIDVLNCDIDTVNRTVSGKGQLKISDYAIKISKRDSTDKSLEADKEGYINSSMRELMVHMQNNNAEVQRYLNRVLEEDNAIKNVNSFITVRDFSTEDLEKLRTQEGQETVNMNTKEGKEGIEDKNGNALRFLSRLFDKK